MHTFLKFNIIFCLFLALSLASCGSKPSEGTITYSIEYPEIKEEFLKGLMPSQMIFQFKDNRFVSVLTTKADQLTITLIGNSNDYVVEQGFKFGSQLIKSKLNKSEIHAINTKEYGAIHTTFTEETKEIAGFKAKKAIINSAILGAQEVFYTEDIAFKDPNWSYPFPEIKGIPLEYQIDRMGLKMKLTAISFTKNSIESSEFELSNTYKSVNYSYFEQEIRSLLDNFMDLGS